MLRPNALERRCTLQNSEELYYVNNILLMIHICKVILCFHDSNYILTLTD